VAYVAELRQVDEVRLLSSLDDYSFMRKKKDGLATKAAIREGIEQWSRDARTLFVVMLDHGTPPPDPQFILDSSSGGKLLLSGEELDAMLDTAQSGTDPLPLAVVIIDSCFSEGMMKKLAPDNGGMNASSRRILMASARESEYAAYGAVPTSPNMTFSEYMRRGETVSFTANLFADLFMGADLGTAFRTVREDFLSFDEIGQKLQRPVIDSDGDGLGNEDVDTQLAYGTLFGNGIILGADPPEVRNIGISLSSKREGQSLELTLQSDRPLSEYDSGFIYLSQVIVTESGTDPIILTKRVELGPDCQIVDNRLLCGTIPVSELPITGEISVIGYLSTYIEGSSPLLPSAPFIEKERVNFLSRNAVGEAILLLRSALNADLNGDGVLDAADVMGVE
jgi:hypothetical protein